MLIPLTLALGSLAATPAEISAGDPPSTTPVTAEAAAMASARARALEALTGPLAPDLDDAGFVRARARQAAAGATFLPEGSEIGRALAAAASEALRCVGEQPLASRLLLEMVTEEAARDLAFEPIMEAPLPVGFPAPVPAGEIAVLEYPRYRLARADMRGGQNGTFFTLFRHIQSNDIPMTAPVEMTMTDDGTQMMDMAFLYQSPEVGEARREGRVEITDIEPMLVVSIGVRGTTRGPAARQALKELEAWLERNALSYRADGNPRLMGYNGPSVPRRKQFCEVQIPVRRLEQ